MPSPKRSSNARTRKSAAAAVEPAPIKELRAIRKKMWAEASEDIDKLMKMAEREARTGGKTKSSARARKKPAA